MGEIWGRYGEIWGRCGREPPGAGLRGLQLRRVRGDGHEGVRERGVRAHLVRVKGRVRARVRVGVS